MNYLRREETARVSKTKNSGLITREEKRFIRSWQEQREGGKWQYYLLYTFVGGFIITLICYILLLWIMQTRVPKPYWLLPTIGIALSTVITVFVWNRNEKRFKAIIRREIASGSPDGQH